MNKPISNIRKRVAQIASSMLFLCAAALAVSATQTSRKDPKPACIWPPVKHKDEIKKAIGAALDKSITDEGFRNQLLDCKPEKCDAPKKAVRRLLDEMYPDLHIADFPKRVVFVFYQPEMYPTEAELKKRRRKSWDPFLTNSCYSIFHLPKYTGKDVPGSPKIEMGNHFLCCYPPW
jgi:hypothetical protein